LAKSFQHNVDGPSAGVLDRAKSITSQQENDTIYPKQDEKDRARIAQESNS